MKKLSKSAIGTRNTIEAYGCSCSSCPCYCNCSSTTSSQASMNGGTSASGWHGTSSGHYHK